MRNAIVIIGSVLIILALIFFVGYMVYNYNDGICPKCHTEYTEFQFIYNGKSVTDYECPTCGNGGRIFDWLR